MLDFNFYYSPPQNKPKILYVDDSLIITSKDAEILTVPGQSDNDSLTTRIKELYPEANPVHRLDCSTSGIVIFSRNRQDTHTLSESFKNKHPLKIYLAWVAGIVKEECGAYDWPMSKDFSQSARTKAPIQMVDYVNGKKALTFFRVIARDYTCNRTAVLLFPGTGRTHQLRLHLSQAGHPILGDFLYWNQSRDALEKMRQDLPKRLLLHAGFLKFTHPRTGKIVRVQAVPDFPFPMAFAEMFLDIS